MAQLALGLTLVRQKRPVPMGRAIFHAVGEQIPVVDGTGSVPTHVAMIQCDLSGGRRSGKACCI